MPRCPAGSPSTAAASAVIRSTRRSCSCRDLSRELRNRNRVTVTVVRWLGRYGVRWGYWGLKSHLGSRASSTTLARAPFKTRRGRVGTAVPHHIPDGLELPLDNGVATA